MRYVSQVLRLALWLVMPALPLAAADAPVDPAGVIYPRNSPEARQHPVADDSYPLWGSLGVIAVLTAGGIYLLKRGALGPRVGAKFVQRLMIEETRPLGNKQFLAVATYGDRRMLLGVCAGRIDLLCRLDEPGAVAEAKPAEVEARR
ncbi:MAG: flagellar biosynthetic protein FliO [Opitutaceae bacterium]|nr:flagellar biosynthetic protein FliO [Opitutaceae bacterium]